MLHVCDLALGHLAAIEHLPRISGAQAFNLGTGEGTSVLQLIKQFEAVTAQTISYEVVDRRDSDLPTFWAGPTLAASKLGWIANLSVDKMCLDAWNYACRSPIHDLNQRKFLTPPGHR